MNEILDIDRARLTAIVLRLISELAGGDPRQDREVAAAMSAVARIGLQSKLHGTPEQKQLEWNNALELIGQKDWLFTVKKIADSFQFEAKFGAEMKTAGLQESVRWLSEAGAN